MRYRFADIVGMKGMWHVLQTPPDKLRYFRSVIFILDISKAGKQGNKY